MQFSKYLCSVFIVLMLSMGTSQLANAADDQVILVLGDSLSAAYDMAVEDGWVALLQEQLKQAGLPQRVLNESISGDTSGNGLYRMPEILTRAELSHLILVLGANDGLRGMPFGQLRDNLGGIMDLALEQNPEVQILLVGVILPMNYGSFYTNGFAKVYADLQAARSLPLIPNILENVPLEEAYFNADRLHPNENAQPIMMQNVWSELQKLIPAASG